MHRPRSPCARRGRWAACEARAAAPVRGSALACLHGRSRWQTLLSGTHLGTISTLGSRPLFSRLRMRVSVQESAGLQGAPSPFALPNQRLSSTRRAAPPCPPIPPRAPSAATLARRQHSQGSGCDPAARAARQGAQLRGRPVRAHAPGARLRARALPAPLAGGVDRLGHHHLAQAHHAARAAPGGREGGAPTATRAGGGGNEARARQKERDAGSFRVRRGSRATRWPPGVITTHPWPQTRQGVAPGHACARGATPGVELRGTRSALTERQRTPSPWRPARGRRQAQRR